MAKRVRSEAGTLPELASSLRFRADLGLEFLFVDDESFVTSLGDQIHPIVGADSEGELPALDRDQFDGGGALRGRRRRDYESKLTAMVLAPQIKTATRSFAPGT